MRTLVLMLGCVIGLGSCAGGNMKAYYPKSEVQPVHVEKSGADAVSITYRVPMETRFYSDGANYLSDGDSLRIYIDRCEIGKDCKPMAKTEIPLDDKWMARVSIPYKGGKIVLVHADGDQELHP